MKHLVIAAALCLSGMGCGCVTMSSEPPDMQTMHESRPAGTAKALDLDLKYDVGNLEIAKTADSNLFSFDLQYDRRRYDPAFRFEDGERASMRLALNGRHDLGGRTGHNDNDLSIHLSDQLPMNLDLTTGVSESRLELTSLQIQRLHLRGGVGKTEVTFDKAIPAPMHSLDVESGVGELIIHGLGNTRVEQVDLKGGIGRTELDFTGAAGMATIDATVKVGVGAVRLTIPRDADVDLEGRGGFLSNISAPSFDRQGHTYTHRGGGGSHLHIRVESGIGSVEVELI